MRFRSSFGTRSGPRHRYRTLLATVFASALVLGACGGGDAAAPDAPTAGEDDSTESPDAPEPSGEDRTFVVAIGADPQHINNGLTTDLPTILASNQVYEPLLRLDTDGQTILPHLATDWEFSDDFMSLSISLRDDVMWHDGEPFTADDVAFSYLELNGQYNGQGTAAYEVIDTIEIVDDHNLVINFGDLDPSFYPWSLVQTTYALIYPEHIFSEGDPLENPANFEPVGTGPFKFVSWDPGSALEFERNEDYWIEGLPHIDRLVFQIIPSPEARVNSIVTGAVDYIPYTYFPLAAYDELDANPEIFVGGFPRPQAGMNLMFYNFRQEPTDDQLVRQAIAYAIDRDAIVANATDGRMKPPVALIGSTDLFFSPPSTVYTRDVDRANEMLDEAGYPAGSDGTRFSLRISYDSDVFAGSLDSAAQIMRENLRDVGIDLVLQPMDNATWSDTAAVNWDFDLTMGSFGVGPDPATGVNRLVVCDAIEPRLGRNTSGYCNPELDELMIGAARTGDPAERAALYAAAQDLMAEELPVLPIWENSYFIAHRTGFENLPEGIFMQEAMMFVKHESW